MVDQQLIMHRCTLVRTHFRPIRDGGSLQYFSIKYAASCSGQNSSSPTLPTPVTRSLVTVKVKCLGTYNDTLQRHVSQLGHVRDSGVCPAAAHVRQDVAVSKSAVWLMNQPGVNMGGSGGWVTWSSAMEDPAFMRVWVLLIKTRLWQTTH